EAAERNVYLPPGAWIDYQTGRVYRGGWQRIAPGQIPVILLVKDHSAIPHIKIAQSTAEMDWKNIEVRVFSSDTSAARGLFCLPQGKLESINLESNGKSYSLKNDTERGEVNWHISSAH
ncbi:MAG TPA: alpha-xylosidase, partial [Blastocatellia bacterium]|nr:alpha-xylosidase [Blastocatellia bacterium]